MNLDTVERARGRWREILPQLGIETRFLTNRHGPCPICGGRDRYRFDDRDGTGSFYCNQCGPGAGILLVRRLHGWDHRTACEAVDRIIGNGKPRTVQPATPKCSDRNAAAIERILREAQHPDVVDAYLARRGLRVISEALKGHWRCPYFSDEGSLVGTYPAVIAPIHDAAGKLQSVQRIYSGDLGGHPRKKIMPPVETISGGAVRLHEPTDELGVAEGIENALAAFQIFGIPTWAALFAENLKRFEPPSGISGLHIYADHDSNYVGQEAAFCLAKRLASRGFPVEVHIPNEVDTDWLDLLAGEPAR